MLKMQVEFVVVWLIVFSRQVIAASLNQGLKVGLCHRLA